MTHSRVRCYEVVTRGRTQPETIIPNLANDQDFNRCTYVRNNPVNFNDPSGHAPCPPNDAGCVANTSEFERQQGSALLAGCLGGSDRDCGSLGVPNRFKPSPTDGFDDPADYILSEMNDNRGSVGSHALTELFLFWNVRPGGAWDHKQEIRDAWGFDNVVEVDGTTWQVRYDMWSNMHFGFVVADTDGYLIPDDIWIGCPAYCPDWIVGAENPLDRFYIDAGYELRTEFGDGPITREAFDAFLGPKLEFWETLDQLDGTAPRRPG